MRRPGGACSSIVVSIPAKIITQNNDKLENKRRSNIFLLGQTEAVIVGPAEEQYLTTAAAYDCCLLLLLRRTPPPRPLASRGWNLILDSSAISYLFLLTYPEWKLYCWICSSPRSFGYTGQKSTHFIGTPNIHLLASTSFEYNKVITSTTLVRRCRRYLRNLLVLNALLLAPMGVSATGVASLISSTIARTKNRSPH